MLSETIYYDSPLGILRITAGEDAITEVHFLHPVKDETQKTDGETTPSSAILKKCIQQLDKYFAGDTSSFELALSQKGTLFQKKVWDALCDIPFGKTVSYLELSKRLGDTKAIRAVGTANGRNNIAIIVPCHRVIGSNGSLVGYAGELWRKKWLLEHEAKFANGVQMLF
jgi:methylated-DNA-[protein]-cysteine S-methyltransferase